MCDKKNVHIIFIQPKVLKILTVKLHNNIKHCKYICTNYSHRFQQNRLNFLLGANRPGANRLEGRNDQGRNAAGAKRLGGELDLGRNDPDSFEYSQHMFWLRNKKNILHLSGALSGCSHVVLYIEHDGYNCTLICLSNNTDHVVKLFISLKTFILKFAEPDRKQHRSFYIWCIHMFFSIFHKELSQTPVPDLWTLGLVPNS